MGHQDNLEVPLKGTGPDLLGTSHVHDQGLNFTYSLKATYVGAIPSETHNYSRKIYYRASVAAAMRRDARNSGTKMLDEILSGILGRESQGEHRGTVKDGLAKFDTLLATLTS